MLENIIFGILVVIAVTAGIITCLYEVRGSSRAETGGRGEPEQTIERNQYNEN